MSLHHIRVPPDSSGKRVLQAALVEIVYGSGTIAFMPGDVVIGASSGITGTVTRVTGSLATGTVFVQLHAESGATVTVGEALLVAATPYAAIVGATPYVIQATTAVSADDALNGQIINEYGASLVAFTEGQPTLTSDGALRVGNAYTLGRYAFVDHANMLAFWQDLAGAGAITHAPQSSSMVLQTSSANNDRARLVTMRYHPYVPGVGNTALFSVVVGDAGKVGNTREWGYGDALNGLFWTLTGASQGVTVRSDTSGVAVNTFVPRTAWNGDPLDGTGPSRFTLDITKRNVYWIDFLWLGAGAVRFGVFDTTGRRLIAHTAYHVGTGVLPYMSTATLPLSVTNHNTTATASTSEIRLICMAVASNSTPDYAFTRFSDVQSPAFKPITDMTPMISIRPKLTFAGKVNRIQIVPDTVSIFVRGGPVRVDFIFGVQSLTAPTWIGGTASLEYDTAATGIGAFVRKVISLVLDIGGHNIDLAQFIEFTSSAVGLHPDGTTQPVLSCVLSRLDPLDTVTAMGGLTHREFLS